MYRKYLQRLESWIDDPLRKPLMVYGARQVGKSYLVEELFAKKYFRGRYLRIDLSDDDDFLKYAEKNPSLTKILEYIHFHYHFVPDEKHLLIFDEIQECPSIVKTLKHFREKRRDIPVIATGSLVRLSVYRNSKNKGRKFLFPVGNIEELHVYPMTFDEFLYNYDIVKYNYVKNAFGKKADIDEIIHKELMDDFRTYMFVGGMPEAINAFLLYKNDRAKAHKEAEKKIKEIYNDYLNDMDLYQSSTDAIIKTKLIYKDVYRQLNKEKENFKISQTIKGGKNRDMVNPYFWLTTSNVLLQSFCLKEKVSLPLMRNNNSLFRFYLSDVGLFAFQSGLDYERFLIDRDNAFSGIYYENYLATELTARGYELFYWEGKRNSEFEFVIDINGSATPIDAKKGRNKLNSLAEFRSHNKKGLAIKVSNNRFGYNEKDEILTLPFYYFSFYLDNLKENRSEN